MPILERIDRWYVYATHTGRKIERILIHPSDAWEAPAEYKGLPVEVMGRDRV